MMFCLENDCPLEMDKCSTPRQVVRTRNSCWKEYLIHPTMCSVGEHWGFRLMMIHSDVAVGGT
ncbi:hypothetical protein OROMI_023850 [Orobanche minor]